MTLNKFGKQTIYENGKIRSVIHFNDSAKHKSVGHPNHDDLHKIRPVVKHLNKLLVSMARLDQRLPLGKCVLLGGDVYETTKTTKGISSSLFCVH